MGIRQAAGYPGMPGLPGDLPMMPQVAQELLERMPMAGVPNLAPVMTDLAGARISACAEWRLARYQHDAGPERGSYANAG